jgi:hypothetical protein
MPVIVRAAGEARKNTASAMSSGAGSCFSACVAIIFASLRRPASMRWRSGGVITNVGATLLTRMPCGPSSTASSCVSRAIAALPRLYAGSGKGAKLLIEPTVTIAPAPRGIMRRPKLRQACTVPW